MMVLKSDPDFPHSHIRHSLSILPMSGLNIGVRKAVRVTIDLFLHILLSFGLGLEGGEAWVGDEHRWGEGARLRELAGGQPFRGIGRM